MIIRTENSLIVIETEMYMPTQIEPFHDTKSIGRVGMTSSMPTQFLDTSCGYDTKYLPTIS